MRLRRAHRIEAETFDRHLSDEMSAGEAFHVHAKEFDRVRRYISSIERAMYRAMKELDLLQAARFAAEREEQAAADLAVYQAEEEEFVSQNQETQSKTGQQLNQIRHDPDPEQKAA